MRGDAPGDMFISIESMLTVATGANLGVMIWNRDLELAGFNDLACEVLGVATDEFPLGSGYVDVVSRISEIAQETSDGARWGATLPLTDFESARRYIDAHPNDFAIVHGRNDAGIVVRRAILDDRWMISMLTDTRGLEAEQRELVRERMYLRTTVETMTDGVMMIDADGSVLSCNRSFCEMFMVDPADFRQGMSVEEFALLHSYDLHLPESERFAAAADRARFARGIGSPGRQHTIERHLGNGIVRSVTRIALPTGGAVITCRDVSDRSELALQRTLLKTVIDNVDEGVTLIGPDGIFRVVNDRMLALYGIPFGLASEGDHVSDFARASGDLEGLSPEEAEEEIRDRVRYATLQHPPVSRKTRTLRNGRTLSISRTVLDDGSAVATYRDITQETERARLLEKAKKTAEDANALKSNFMAKVTHELRTPMNGVLGVAALMQKSTLTDEQKGLLEILERSGRHMVDLIDSLLTITTLDTGDLELLPESLDLDEVLSDCFSLVRSQAEAKGLEVQLNRNLYGGTWVRADPMRLRQILLNLLGNAVKFTDRGFVKLAARTRNTPEGLHTRISVVDSGPGIAAIDLDRIFESFTQLDGNCDARRKGVGLGLSIAKSLSTLMGGDLSVSSTQGQGTVFTLTVVLPRAEKVAGNSEKPAA